MLQQDRLLLSVTEWEQHNRIWFNKITCSRKCTLFPLRQHPFDFFIARKIHGMSRTGSSNYSRHSMKCSPQALLGYYCSHSLCYTTVSSRCVRINRLHSSLKFIKISTSEAGYGKWYRNWNFIIILPSQTKFWMHTSEVNISASNFVPIFLVVSERIIRQYQHAHTLIQSTGYMTQCSVIPAVAPANICVEAARFSGSPS